MSRKPTLCGVYVSHVSINFLYSVRHKNMFKPCVGPSGDFPTRILSCSYKLDMDKKCCSEYSMMSSLCFPIGHSRT